MKNSIGVEGNSWEDRITGAGDNGGGGFVAIATESDTPSAATGFDRNDLLALVPHMRGFARSLCRDHAMADDLTQDALVSALKRQETFTTGTNLKAWLFTILRNQFFSEKRKSWRAKPLDQKMAEETLVALSNPMASLELEDVRAAMLSLCVEQREALILIAVAGLPYVEAAKVSGCAVGTIKSRVSRARQTLAAALADDLPIARTPVPGGAMNSLLADANRLCGWDVAKAPPLEESAADDALEAWPRIELGYADLQSAA